MSSNFAAPGNPASGLSQNGLPPGTVNCLLQDSTGTLWIGTANGLGFLRSRTIHTVRDVPESLHEQIFGIEEDKTGSLWMTTSNHVLRVDRNALCFLGIALSWFPTPSWALHDVKLVASGMTIGRGRAGVAGIGSLLS